MIDTQTSNLRSVENAFRRIGAEIETVTDATGLETAEAVVLPGVGAFESARAKLRSTGMDNVLRRRVAENGLPVVGICLGMQLLASRSEENGDHEGLGLIDGIVRRLDPADTDNRVPNMGWCDVHPEMPGALFADRRQTDAFYFVHSFYFDCADKTDIAATIDFGGAAVPVAVERGNVMGVQFHPEKSQDAGLDLIQRVTRKLADKAA